MKKILTVILLLVAIVTKTPHAWAKSPPGNENTIKFIKEKIAPANNIGNASYDPVTQDVFISQFDAIIPEANIQRARPGPIIGIINFTTISDKSSNIAARLKKEKTTWSAADPANTGNYSMPIPAD